MITDTLELVDVAVAKQSIEEYSTYISDTQKLRRLPEATTQAQIIREEFRHRHDEVEHITCETGSRGRQLVSNHYGTNRDQATSRDITPMSASL